MFLKPNFCAIVPYNFQVISSTKDLEYIADSLICLLVSLQNIKKLSMLLTYVTLFYFISMLLLERTIKTPEQCQ